jgi:hypothetical protein
VARLNARAEFLDLPSVVPLEPAELIATACGNTGLDDFGEGDWYGPFTALVEDLNENARLHLLGRMLTRQDLLTLLEQRLRVEAAYRAQPEIEDEEIRRPLVIVGQGRTGTTVLQAMLASHPDNRTLLHWETLFPGPPLGADAELPDRRIERAEGRFDTWNQVIPEVVAMREFAAMAPAETIQAQALSFNAPNYFCPVFGQALNYHHRMLTEYDITDAYRYEKRVMKLLQWRQPRKRWILKSPVILGEMPQLLEVYPDAAFIWTHRDPVKALASVVSLIGTLQWMRSDHPLMGDSMAHLTTSEGVAGLLMQPIEWLRDGTVPADRLCNVHYRDFVADPVAVAERVYDYFDLELTTEGRAAMSRYMTANPREARPAHRYEYGSDADVDLAREAFKDYAEYFGVPAETEAR